MALLTTDQERAFKVLARIAAKYGREVAEAVEQFPSSDLLASQVATMAGVTESAVRAWVRVVCGRNVPKKKRRSTSAASVMEKEASRSRARAFRRQIRVSGMLRRLAGQYGQEVADAVRDYRVNARSCSEIARMAGVTREAARQWVRQYHGVEGTKGLAASRPPKDWLSPLLETRPALAAAHERGYTVERVQGAGWKFLVGGVKCHVSNGSIFVEGRNTYIRTKGVLDETVEFYLIAHLGHVYVLPTVMFGFRESVYLRLDKADAFKDRWESLGPKGVAA